MIESLIEGATSDASSLGAIEAPAPSIEASTRPASVPEKFWDEDKGQLRTDALVKSYIELERKLSTLSQRNAPPTPEDYRIADRNGLLSSDLEVNRRLHAAGFTQEQAELVYELASERLMPMISEVASMFEAESQIERLTHHFGGEDRWREAARQIKAWGQSRLPARVFEALSTTYDGVITMHRMMTEAEPTLLHDGTGSKASLSDAELKQMMRDPRYWRDQDPVLVEKVRAGFRRLYAEQPKSFS